MADGSWGKCSHCGSRRVACRHGDACCAECQITGGATHVRAVLAADSTPREDAYEQADEACRRPREAGSGSPCGRPADEGPCPYPHPPLAADSTPREGGGDRG